MGSFWKVRRLKGVILEGEEIEGQALRKPRTPRTPRTPFADFGGQNEFSQTFLGKSNSRRQFRGGTRK